MILSLCQSLKHDRTKHDSTNLKIKTFSLILTKILTIRKLKNELIPQLYSAIKIEFQT